MVTKHEKIINYITDLPIDSKISVRRISRDLNVSNGTAYRAIKEAENRHLVKTFDRVGTIRVEAYQSKQFEQLKIREVVALTNCEVLGGEAGLDLNVHKFIIGAMQAEAVLHYLAPETVMLIGNRENIQRTALEHGTAVIITGGFRPSEEIIELANKKAIPLMAVSFDTYSTATIINKAMIERSIQRDIIQVEDIYIPIEQTIYLEASQTVADYRALNEQYKHSRFPVVDATMQLVGVVTAKDLLGLRDEEKISDAMTREPLVAKPMMAVVSATHMMIWDGLEMLPVVNDEKYLLGIVTRQDILKTLEYTKHSLHDEERIEGRLNEKIIRIDDKNNTPRYRFTSDATMISEVGALSTPLLTMLLQLVTVRYFSEFYGKAAIIDQVHFINLRLAQMGSTLDIEPKLILHGRHNAHVEMRVYHGQTLLSQATISVQLPLSKADITIKD